MWHGLPALPVRVSGDALAKILRDSFPALNAAHTGWKPAGSPCHKMPFAATPTFPFIDGRAVVLHIVQDRELPMSPRRLYLDNAATSFPKPPGVTEAMVRYAQDLGASAGRGAYREAVETAAMIGECRRRLNQAVQRPGPRPLCLHAQLLGRPQSGDQGAGRSTGKWPRDLQPRIDHNSILRPLRAMEEHGWTRSRRGFPWRVRQGSWIRMKFAKRFDPTRV